MTGRTIVPIHEKDNVQNYRGITLLRIIYNQLNYIGHITNYIINLVFDAAC